MKILLVDDSKTVCAIYSSLLEENGYEVLLAYSMIEAFELAKQHRPSLAIVDFYMPEGNGDELTRALLQNPTTSSIVVAMHSQFPNVVEKALQAGAVELIGKDDPHDLFMMRVNALKTMVEAQTFQRNIERLLDEKDLEHKPISILLVDDSATVRAVYGSLLRKEGFVLHEAETINSAMVVARQELPDMMLVDYTLPDGNGAELVRELLGRADTSNILMVMFSNREDMEEAALSAGAIDIISKDDPHEIIMRRIRSMQRYVESQRKQRQIMQESNNKSNYSGVLTENNP
ncbi:MAG: response regulator [Gammaproteobacteria bacterium]|jgi:CheY-like chemotaxis protein|nr:response regulator [Gammaproteobacteria bacterium]MBT3490564.1 response regulator [Gammaproteobacteria bacterium]MBT3717417.1 response regulator [Gammaproteobacteria bacterium]MBT3844459.1 response regulator [Gammaproteobacteria bacterium]MBT3893612.1 response regulator [Gammaproteobacteria bacterium]